MSNFVHGKDVILEAYIIDGYKPFLCATDATIEFLTEIIFTTTADSSDYRTKYPRLFDGRITLSGVTTVDGTTGPTVFETTLEQIRKQGYNIRLTYTDSNGNEAFFTAPVLISSTTINGLVTDYSGYTVVFEMNGAPGIDTGELATQASEIMKYDYTATGDETTIGDPVMVSRTILLVDRSSSMFEVITTGTPTGNQVLYDSTTGDFTFADALYPEEYILILYK